ncbi:MAG TPA: MFS transporter [Geminicoccaceae bacterium]|nr:MFS transporter [Geminicoccaceae bacterium]
MTDLTGGVPRRHDLKVMSLIAAGHFLSHFYIMVLPPLFPLLRGAYGVSYTALGLAIAVLNGTTALTQAPVGFLVDRFGARAILIAGLALFALATGLIGLFPTYPALIVLMVVAGLGNSVFHPADYAILSASVNVDRMGRAFSIHTFGGYFGFAAAPVTVVFLAGLLGWQWALVVCGGAGLAVTLLMLANSEVLLDDSAARRARAAQRRRGADLRLLLSLPILTSLAFFGMIALSQGGLTSFGVSALASLYDVSLVEANAPLSAYLFVGAFGVLAGGWAADRTHRHDWLVGACIVLVAVLVAAVAALAPSLVLVTVLLGLAGFFSGAVAPSRDMMVRAITPPGSSGKVFGFVTTGFNIGGLITPLIFGMVMDHGEPRLVFWLVAILSLVTLITVFGTGRHSRAGRVAAGAD